MRKSARRLLIASGMISAGTAAFFLASYSITKRLVMLALDREVPKSGIKSRFKISGVTKEDPQGKNIDIASDKLKKNAEKRVHIQSFDGVKLVGHLYESKVPKRIIIAMHGWRSSWSYDFGMISDFWHDSGSTVLYPEQRAHNDSGGKYLGFGMIERYDCLCWAKWVQKNISKTLPVYLAGLSMGASTVLMASELNLPENVCGIMADSGFTSAHDIWEHVTKNNLHLSYRLISSFADGICRKKINMGSREYSTKDALSKTKIPVLLIHGAHDKFVPASMTYENYLACKSKKEILIVPGAGHCRSYLIDKEKYEKTVRNFWKKCE